MDKIMKEEGKAHKEAQLNYRASANRVQKAGEEVRKTKAACEKYDARAKKYRARSEQQVVKLNFECLESEINIET